MSLKKSSKKNGFPWKIGCLLLLVLASAVVAYDIHKWGSFEGK